MNKLERRTKLIDKICEQLGLTRLHPDKLKEMIHASNANSTQMLDEESVDDLTDKCQQVSRNWAPAADKIRRKSDKLSVHVNKMLPRFWDENWDETEELIDDVEIFFFINRRKSQCLTN